MTTRTGCTQTLLSSDYIFFFHQRNRVFDCLLFGQAALVFSEFIFNRKKEKRKKKKGEKRGKNISYTRCDFFCGTSVRLGENQPFSSNTAGERPRGVAVL